MRLLGVSYEAYTANKHSMEGQNFLRSVPLTMLIKIRTASLLCGMSCHSWNYSA